MNDLDNPKGDGIYPHYSALWHLQEIGVFDVKTGTSAIWDDLSKRQIESEKATTVALIDNSVAWDHPNLQHAIDKRLMIDFFAAPLGAFPARHEITQDSQAEGQSTEHKVRAATAAPFDSEELLRADHIRTIAGQTKNAGVASLVNAFLERLRTPTDAHLSTSPATHTPFSAHGTAMAGLIGARPTTVQVTPIETIGNINERAAKHIQQTTSVLPYSGVDPFCQIVPISTSFDPDPEQLILALLYADLIDADVIVIARDFPDPRKQIPPQPASEAKNNLWGALELIIKSVSRQRVILCAAGNGADNNVIYPASLADEKNGEENGIVAVGARTAKGTVAGYSPSNLPGGLFAPSGDGERLDSEIQRLDVRSPGFDPADHSHQYIDTLVKENPTDGYSSQDLISTDVQGQFGYNGSFYRGDNTADVTDFGSYFCRFSGTSGAVAVAGGLVSLAYTSGTLKRPFQHEADVTNAAVQQGEDGTAGVAAKKMLLEHRFETNDEEPRPRTNAPAVQILTWNNIGKNPRKQWPAS
jgi:hypothetical protein